MSSPSPPQPRPEGDLIRVATKRARLSARKAAEMAGISEGRWRQIVSGYQTVSRGMHVPVKGPPETVALMADTVGVTADELAAADREDAAQALRERQAANAKRNDASAAVGAEAGASDPRWSMLLASINAAGAELSKRERALLRRKIEDFLQQNPEWQPPEETQSEAGQSPRQTG